MGARIMLWDAAVAAIAAGAVVLLPPGWRLGALCGLAAAALSSALCVALLARGFDRGGLKQAFAAVAVGFMVRMIAVAAGLLVALRAEADLIAYCAGFFAVYFAHQAIEIVHLSRARPRVSEGSA